MSQGAQVPHQILHPPALLQPAQHLAMPVALYFVQPGQQYCPAVAHQHSAVLICFTPALVPQALVQGDEGSRIVGDHCVGEKGVVFLTDH